MNEATAFQDYRDAQKKRKARANQGKESENAVKKWLNAKVEQIGGLRFAWDRPVDTREAGGTVKAVVGDYDLMYAGKLLTLEVKETAVIDKLPRANIKQDQVNRLVRRSLAGVPTIVLVHHTSQGLWRWAPIAQLKEHESGPYPTHHWQTFRSAPMALDSLSFCLFK